MYKATVFSVTDFIGGIIGEKQSKGDIKSVQYWWNLLSKSRRDKATQVARKVSKVMICLYGLNEIKYQY